MPTLVLYHFPSCPYCRRVQQYLAKHKIAVPEKDILKDRKAAEELYRIGGKSQVPCLVIDGKALYESHDIIRWFKKHAKELA